jgi:hypothetical protein
VEIVELISEAVGESGTEVDGADGVRRGGRGGGASERVHGVSTDDTVRSPVGVVIEIDCDETVGNVMDTGEDGVAEVMNVDGSAVLLGKDGSSVDKGIEELLDESRRGSVEMKGVVKPETLDAGKVKR